MSACVCGFVHGVKIINVNVNGRKVMHKVCGICSYSLTLHKHERIICCGFAGLERTVKWPVKAWNRRVYKCIYNGI